MRLFKSKSGFTLVEVLFVIIVIAVLAAIAMMRITTSRATADTNACKANQAIINTQLQQYELDGNTPPADQTAFQTWLDNTSYFPQLAPKCPKSGSKANYAYTTTPTPGRANCNTAGHALW